MDFAIVLAIGLFAGTVGGIVGTGSSMILMPALVLAWGPLEAVPVMAIAAILGNLGRVIAWRVEVNWRAAWIYCLAAIPGAALGVRTLLAVPAGVIESALGVFFLGMVPMRRWLAHRQVRLSLAQLALLSGPLGFLTGIVVSTGPLTVPLFTMYGLGKGSLLGTVALASFAVYLAKVTTFRGFDALPATVAIKGLVAGSALMAGSFAGRRVVLRLAPSTFHLMIDGLMVFSDGTLLWAATR
ncbi:TSUP family transporter [Ramlibacter sp. MAHUQ-53]|uniref:TSUP family transporter n=1 Tax=unclassified Ramlibacter TaxID=2617605 RepID=UPI0036404B9B